MESDTDTDASEGSGATIWSGAPGPVQPKEPTLVDQNEPPLMQKPIMQDQKSGPDKPRADLDA
eukprot:1095268-Prorocentrum_lima.AAC.1